MAKMGFKMGAVSGNVQSHFLPGMNFIFEKESKYFREVLQNAFDTAHKTLALLAGQSKAFPPFRSSSGCHQQRPPRR